MVDGGWWERIGFELNNGWGLEEGSFRLVFVIIVFIIKCLVGRLNSE